MKKFLPFVFIILLAEPELRSQVIIDTVALVSLEDTSARFCFNNTKLMAGAGINDRYLVYYNSDTIFLNVNQAGAWTKKVVTVSANLESATMTLHQDTVWVCWKGGAFINASFSADQGNAWNNILPVSPGGNVSAPSVCASSNGKIHFVWSTNTLTDTIVYHRVYFNGNFLTNPYALSNSGGDGLWPSIISVGDTVFCAWKEAPLPTKVWFASSFNGGTSWNSPDTTFASLPVSKDPNLAYAFDSSTNTHYLYLAFDSQNKIYLQRSTDFGNSWSVPLVVSDPNKLSQFAHLECNNNGFVGISYEHRTGTLFDDTQKDVGFVYSTSWADSGSFGTDTLAYTHNFFGSVYPSLNKIDENNFYLVWLTKDTLTYKTKVFERRVYFDNATGIAENDLDLQSNVTVYPNPNNGCFSLTLPPLGNNSELRIFNIRGYKVFSEIFYANTNEITINNFDLPAGNYLVTLKDNNITKAQRLVVVY